MFTHQYKLKSWTAQNSCDSLPMQLIKKKKIGWFGEHSSFPHTGVSVCHFTWQFEMLGVWNTDGIPALLYLKLPTFRNGVQSFLLTWFFILHGARVSVHWFVGCPMGHFLSPFEWHDICMPRATLSPGLCHLYHWRMGCFINALLANVTKHYWSI